MMETISGTVTTSVVMASIATSSTTTTSSTDVAFPLVVVVVMVMAMVITVASMLLWGGIIALNLLEGAGYVALKKLIKLASSDHPREVDGIYGRSSSLSSSSSPSSNSNFVSLEPTWYQQSHPITYGIVMKLLSSTAHQSRDCIHHGYVTSHPDPKSSTETTTNTITNHPTMMECYLLGRQFLVSWLILAIASSTFVLMSTILALSLQWQYNNNTVPSSTATATAIINTHFGWILSLGTMLVVVVFITILLGRLVPRSYVRHCSLDALNHPFMVSLIVPTAITMGQVLLRFAMWIGHQVVDNLGGMALDSDDSHHSPSRTVPTKDERQPVVQENDDDDDEEQQRCNEEGILDSHRGHREDTIQDNFDGMSDNESSICQFFPIVTVIWFAMIGCGMVLTACWYSRAFHYRISDGQHLPVPTVIMGTSHLAYPLLFVLLWLALIVSWVMMVIVVGVLETIPVTTSGHGVGWNASPMGIMVCHDDEEANLSSSEQNGSPNEEDDNNDDPIDSCLDRPSMQRRSQFIIGKQVVVTLCSFFLATVNVLLVTTTTVLMMWTATTMLGSKSNDDGTATGSSNSMATMMIMMMITMIQLFGATSFSAMTVTMLGPYLRQWVHPFVRGLVYSCCRGVGWIITVMALVGEDEGDDDDGSASVSSSTLSSSSNLTSIVASIQRWCLGYQHDNVYVGTSSDRSLIRMEELEQGEVDILT